MRIGSGFVGYRYRHVMKVEFPSDGDRLGELLYALANGPGQPGVPHQHTRCAIRRPRKTSCSARP